MEKKRPKDAFPFWIEVGNHDLTKNAVKNQWVTKTLLHYSTLQMAKNLVKLFCAHLTETIEKYYMIDQKSH